MSAPIAPCPICGTPTLGELIVGRIFDHSCDRCREQVDADFDTFITRLINGDIDLDAEP